jgi:hypothetical protein
MAASEKITMARIVPIAVSERTRYMNRGTLAIRASVI